eukprot:g20311.t1
MASQAPAPIGGAESGLSDVDITGDGYGDVDLEDPQGPGRGRGNDDSGVDSTAAAGARVIGSDAGVAAGSELGLNADEEAAGGGGGGGDEDGDGITPSIERNSPLGTRQRPPEGFLGNPMEGVGEDEKPYNYICNLDKVNLGGPGWFNDIFKVSVQVDTDRTWVDTLSLSLVPRNVFQRHCPLLDTSENITGTVTVEAPASKSVWLAGVTVTFEEHLMTVDSDTGELVGALEAQVATGQFIKDKAVFNFNLDLGLLDGHRRWPVRETYVGDLMALRHRLMVSAQRPWYTFNVYSQIPLAMECLSSAPDEDAGQDNEEGGPNHVLVISDCNGRCDFDFGVDSFNLGDVLRGIVRFTDVTSPIVAAHVMLLRAEFMYGEASEVLVAEHTILGERRREKDRLSNGLTGLTEEERARQQFMSPFVEQKDIHFVHTQEEGCRMEEVLGDVDIAVEVPLHSLPLTPSHMSLTQDIAAVNDEAELVGVRYYIRLIVEDGAQQAYWHTHEIFFHRADPTPSSQGVDDVSSDGSGDGRDSGGYSYKAGYDAENLERGYSNTDTNTNGHAGDGLVRIAGSDEDGDGALGSAGAGTQKQPGWKGLGGTLNRSEGPEERGSNVSTAVAPEAMTLESEGGGTKAVPTGSGDHDR